MSDFDKTRLDKLRKYKIYRFEKDNKIKAIDYIIFALKQLGRSLSSRVCAVKLMNTNDKNNDFNIFTWMRPGISMKEMTEFRNADKTEKVTLKEWFDSSGYKVTEVLDLSATPLLAKYVEKIFQKSSEYLCILEDPVMERTDPYVVEYKNQIVLYNNDIYHLVFNWEDNKRICDKIREVETSSLNGFIFKNSGIISPQKIGHSLSDDDLENIAKNVIVILVYSYDGESYIVCEFS